MKSLNFATLALATVCCVSFAQQNDAQDKPKVIVQFDKEKPAMIALDGADGNTFRYTAGDGQKAGDATKCRVFLFQTPAELAAGIKLHAAHKFAEARKKLAACKKKYISVVTLPGNPARQAALLEIQCAVAMQDWAALQAMTSSFPSKGMDAKSELNNVVMVNAAKLLARISDSMSAEDGAKLAKDAETLLANNAMKQTDGRVYGWVKYALARGRAAQVNAKDVASRSISDAQKQIASQAVDAFCEAAVSSHGADTELAADALIRAQAILWAMPGVKAYGDAHPGKMDAKNWKNAPADFKEAVTIAYAILNIYAPGTKSDVLEKAAGFYFNEQEGKKADE